jgi:hypothetical protein
MLSAIIKFVLSDYSLSFLALGLIFCSISLYRQRPKLTRSSAFEALLSYYCLFAIGLGFIYNFVMHVFFADMAAAFIGWANSPFQYEVGFASLGFGVVGILAFRRDFGLRSAAVTGPAFFLWGAAAGHVYQMIAHHNFAPGNAGVIFWTDIFLPAIGFYFLYGWRKTHP